MRVASPRKRASSRGGQPDPRERRKSSLRRFLLSDTELGLPVVDSARTLTTSKNRKGFSVSVLPDLLLAQYSFGTCATRGFPFQV